MARRKRNDLDLAKGILGILLLLGIMVYLHRVQILAVLGWLAVILPIPLLLLGMVCLFFGKKLLSRPNQPDRPRSAPSFAHYPPASSIPSPESSFAPPSFNESQTQAAQKPATPSESTVFTIDFLKKLEWRSFEKLTEALFRTMNLRAERLRAGADGGVDLVLRHPQNGTIEGLVQCKAWNTYNVGVKPIRELFGVMHAEGAPQGYFVCTGQYTREAMEWAQYKPLTLINGEHLLEQLNSLPEGTRHSLIAEILSSDYTTPTCPSCDKKLLRRTSKHGDFWGCSSFPRCRYTMKIATS